MMAHIEMTQLAAINMDRLPIWIGEYRLWANQAEAAATEAREAGSLTRAKRHERTAQDWRQNADRVEANLIGWASR